MNITLNIEKKHFWVLLVLISFVSVAIFVYAVNKNGDPSSNSFGHDASQIDGLSSGGGDVFTTWGRKSCPTGTTKIYDGIAGGSHYTHSGGGANTLCMSKNPNWDGAVYDSGNQNGNLIYKMEYQTANYGLYTFENLDNKDAPCAVCLAPSQTFMHPGSKECPTGWKVVYWGYIMATHYDQHKSEHVCVHKSPGTTGSSGNENGNLWYPTEAQGGFGNYPEDKEVTCSVCIKE